MVAIIPRQRNIVKCKTRPIAKTTPALEVDILPSSLIPNTVSIANQTRSILFRKELIHAIVCIGIFVQTSSFTGKNTKMVTIEME